MSLLHTFDPLLACARCLLPAGLTLSAVLMVLLNSAANMNDLTLPEVASDLAGQGLGGGQFDAETTHQPTIPLQGMLW